MDLLAAVEASVTIDPGRTALIPTGLALRRGIVLPNSPGTVDAGLDTINPV